MQMLCSDQKGFLVQQEISKKGALLPSFQQLWWILGLEWTKLFLKNLKEQVTLKLFWSENFLINEHFLQLTLQNQEHVRKNCLSVKIFLQKCGFCAVYCTPWAALMGWNFYSKNSVTQKTLHYSLCYGVFRVLHPMGSI